MANDEKKLLLIEDDPGLQSQLRWAFEDYQVSVAGDREAALDLMRSDEPPVVTLDLGLPPDAANATEGLLALEQILALAPHTKVIVVTGNDDRANALRAVALGAYDFYQKPVDPDVLGLIVQRAFTLFELEEENRELLRKTEASPLAGVIASSPQMVKACRMVEKVAPTDATILLLGESGTGKELLARALHGLSARKDAPFVAINCAAIPDTLLESELFGYEKGAFTGAAKQTRGKIECAHGGTLFLDEIGDLPPALQAKILRFLQERVIERVGGREVISVDVRVVCATHQDLSEMMGDDKFREDLYYRVNEITLHLPPLRERTGDAVLLAQAFLHKFTQQRGRPIRGFATEALAAIETYSWPGNVRELENRVKRATIMAEGNRIEPEDLELGAPKEDDMPFNLREVRELAEREALQRAMGLAQGNMSKAAHMLGISRPTLYDLLNKFEMK